MELKQLRYFIAVADTLNFSRAAEILYIAQPTLSYQIAELERELGVKLFVRDKRRVILTPSGQALREPARSLLEQADHLTVLASKAELKDSGTLRIGFDDTEDHFELIGVTQAIADFASANPNVHLELCRGPFTECADRVIYDELDLAFLILRHREHLPPDLTSRPVYNAHIVMVVREDSPATTCAEAIRAHDLLLVRAKPRGNSRILHILEEMGLEPHIRYVDSMTSGFVYLQAGQGIMLPSDVYYNQHQYQGMRVIPIESSASVISHQVVWNRNTANPQVARFLESLDTCGYFEESFLENAIAQNPK